MKVNSVATSTKRVDEDMWRMYRKSLLQYIRPRVGEEDAEDILHDVMVKAWQSLGTLRAGTKLSGWLHRITRNAIVDYYRSRRSSQSFDEEEFLPTLEDENHAERELANCLRPMIEQLPAEYRNALYMAELEGRRQQEIADKEGLSISGAKSRVQRGRKQLKEILDRCCHIELSSSGSITGYSPREECNCKQEC